MISLFGSVDGARAGTRNSEDGKARRRVSWVGRWLLRLGLTAAIVTSAGLSYHYWPRTLPIRLPPSVLSVKSTGTGLIVAAPDRHLIADLAEFDDKFFAYLMFDHYRSREALQNYKLLLISDENVTDARYRLAVELPNDVITAVEKLASWYGGGVTSELDYNWYVKSVVDRYAAETDRLVQEFQVPSGNPLRSVDPDALRRKLAQFIRFKSLTDARTRKSDGAPTPLTQGEADRLAADMIAVADFYEIPLGLMVGVGAMENNFMSVPGDIENTKWKRHPDKGDVVLRRARNRVLVKNDSSGIWQITRESLRYAHRLYQQDDRDYSALPVQLRPPREFQMDCVGSDVLTTYAGLLLADLLQHFDGDVILAAGAYNGTLHRPNLHYAAGVEMVASYARTVIGRSAFLESTPTGPGANSYHQTLLQVSEAQSDPEIRLTVPGVPVGFKEAGPLSLAAKVLR